MTCTWCSNEAVEAGRAPVGVSGLRFIAACEIHKNKIKTLKFIPVPVVESEDTLRLEAKRERQKK